MSSNISRATYVLGIATIIAAAIALMFGTSGCGEDEPRCEKIFVFTEEFSFAELEELGITLTLPTETWVDLEWGIVAPTIEGDEDGHEAPPSAKVEVCDDDDRFGIYWVPPQSVMYIGAIWPKSEERFPLVFPSGSHLRPVIYGAFLVNDNASSPRQFKIGLDF